jgi:hypothetical protein
MNDMRRILTGLAFFVPHGFEHLWVERCSGPLEHGRAAQRLTTEDWANRVLTHPYTANQVRCVGHLRQREACRR